MIPQVSVPPVPVRPISPPWVAAAARDHPAAIEKAAPWQKKAPQRDRRRLLPGRSRTLQGRSKTLPRHDESLQPYRKILQAHGKALLECDKILQGNSKTLQGLTQSLQGTVKHCGGVAEGRDTTSIHPGRNEAHFYEPPASSRHLLNFAAHELPSRYHAFGKD